MYVKCEICEQTIAQAEPEALSMPLKSSMFKSPGEGFNTPWPWELSWLDMRCPYCRKRPFVMTETAIQGALEGRNSGPERVLTPHGFYQIGSNTLPGVGSQHHTPTYSERDLEREWEERMNPTPNAVTVEQLPFTDFRPRPVKKGFRKRG